MIHYFGFFLASFFYVGLLGFQQKAVQHSQYLFILPTSLMISTANYFVVTNAAHNSFWFFMSSAGLGAALGILLSVFIHDKMMSRREER